MIRKYKFCYCNTFCNNICNIRRFRLTIINQTNVCVNFIIQYTVGGETITKKSKYITKGESTNLIFTIDASNIYFNVINNSLATKPLICNHEIPFPKDTCYEVRGTDQQPVCIQLY